jgi:tetratricopeptide (TPR) repeat protein
MKIPVLLGISFLALGIPAFSQDAAGDDKPKLLKWEEEFLNLPEDRRQKFGEHIMKARELFQQKRIFETVEELRNAESIFDESPDLENMYGACQVEFRAFDKAMERFERANALSPNNSNILFNIAEIHFVKKEWKDAERYLERIFGMISGDKAQEQMSRLVEFKLMLCKIKLNDLATAQEIAGRHDHLDDSPFPYYAEAALAFQKGDDVEAEIALGRAGRIFQDPAMIAPWQDTLMEFGYIKSFYGGDLGEE